MLDSERAREIGRLGGLATAKKRNKKRGIREVLVDMLGSDTECENPSACERIVSELIRQAEDGNIKAVEFIRDTIGEKPGSNKEKPELPPASITVRVVE